MTRSRVFLLSLSAALVVAATGAARAESTLTLPYDPFFTTPTVVADLGANFRPFGIAAGDFDGDADLDLVVGRTTGNIALLRGNGNGTFAAPSAFAWKQAYYNAWAMAAADVNGDGHLDVIWGANATSTGCSVSPVPVGGCGTEGSVTVTVSDGEVRVFLGNGDGTFQQNTYYISGVLHNAGSLLAAIGTDAGSLAAGDVDGDSDVDVISGRRGQRSCRRAHAELDQRANGDGRGVGGVAAASVAAALRIRLTRGDDGSEHHRGQQITGRFHCGLISKNI